MKSTNYNLGYYIIYYVLYSILKLFALLPLCLLYILSDILYYIVYYVIRYRRQIVRDNLSGCYPVKNKEDIIDLEKKFYHHFCDYFVETIKLFHISDKEISKRFVFKNVEILDKILKESPSAILTIGHYGNWEWVTSLNILFDPEKVVLCQVYKKIKNQAVNDIFFKLRARFHSVGIDKNVIYREIIKRRKDNQNLLIGFIADQSPSARNIHHWVHFLNKNTPVFVGVEKIAKQTGFAVAYLDIQCPKRGYYEGDIKLITTNPKELPDNYITEKYFEMLEESINRAPQYWLWSHKRWKYKDQEAVEKILNKKNA